MVILYCCICILGWRWCSLTGLAESLDYRSVESMNEAFITRSCENTTGALRVRVFALRTSLEAVHCTKNENVCLSYDFTKLKLEIANTKLLVCVCILHDWTLNIALRGSGLYAPEVSSVQLHLFGSIYSSANNCGATISRHAIINLANINVYYMQTNYNVVETVLFITVDLLMNKWLVQEK